MEKLKLPRRDKLQLSDVCYSNVQLWNKAHWPYGIKADLARGLPLVGNLGEICLYRESVSSCGEMLLTWETEEMEAVVNLHCWSLAHPRKVWPRQTAWQRGAGFSVPARFAPYWSRGVKLLLDGFRDELEQNGEYLFEIQYGESYEIASPRRIRFYHWKSGPTWYACIRLYRWIKKHQAFCPSNRHVYWRVDTPKIGEVFVKALDRAGAVYRDGHKPADSVVTVKLETYRRGF